MDLYGELLMKELGRVADTLEESAAQIKQCCANIGRLGITEDALRDLRKGQEVEEHDKESLEHYRETQQNETTAQISISPHSSQGIASTTHLLKLEAQLPQEETQTLLGSAEAQTIVTDEDDLTAKFSQLSAKERAALLGRLSFTPNFVRLALPARKDLDSNSKHPTLGIDSTLPQHRLEAGVQALPLQYQYPVWYFFYGTLAIPAKLSKLLQLSEEDIKLRRANITGGTMSSWGNQYPALVDGDGSSTATIDGSGFLVQSPHVEDILRAHKTDKYEVVRCNTTLIDFGEAVAACVFKYVG